MTCSCGWLRDRPADSSWVLRTGTTGVLRQVRLDNLARPASTNMLSLLPSWVARDMNGTALENAPFEAVFRDIESAHRFQRHLPVQVQSCWNGIAILDPAPMYAHPHVRFRMAKLSAGECSASECSLICNDYWNAGYGRIIMIPRVKLAYDKVRFSVVSSRLAEAVADSSCLFTASLGHHSSRTKEPHVHPRLHSTRRQPGRPSLGSSGPFLVRSSRSTLPTRRERSDRLPPTTTIWLVPCPFRSLAPPASLTFPLRARSLSLVLGMGRRRRSRGTRRGADLGGIAQHDVRPTDCSSRSVVHRAVAPQTVVCETRLA